MDAVFNLTPDELDKKLLSRIKDLIAGRKDIEVVISLREKKSGYLTTLNHSINQLDNKDETVTFTAEEFNAYPTDK